MQLPVVCADQECRRAENFPWRQASGSSLACNRRQGQFDRENAQMGAGPCPRKTGPTTAASVRTYECRARHTDETSHALRCGIERARDARTDMCTGAAAWSECVSDSRGTPEEKAAPATLLGEVTLEFGRTAWAGAGGNHDATTLRSCVALMSLNWSSRPPDASTSLAASLNEALRCPCAIWLK